MLLAIVQRLHGGDQQVVPDLSLLILGHQLVLERTGVDEEILPLALAAFVAFQRHIEAGVATHRHAAIHRHDFVFGHAQVGRDLRHVLGLQIALFERVDLVLHPAEVEEELLLRSGGAHLHQAPRAQDEFLDRGADPPHRISREAEAALGLELLHALHQADIAFADQLADGQAVAAVAHGDLGHEPQVRIDQLRGGLGVAMLAPALGEHIFFLRAEDRELLDFRKIAVESGLPTGRGERDDPFFRSHSVRLSPFARAVFAALAS